MAFYESPIKDVGTDSKTNQIMSRKRYGSLYPNQNPLTQPKQLSPITNANIRFTRPAPLPNQSTQLAGTFKKGGPVKKTGVYKLHKGEYVMNKKKVMAEKMKA